MPIELCADCLVPLVYVGKFMEKLRKEKHWQCPKCHELLIQEI